MASLPVFGVDEHTEGSIMARLEDPEAEPVQPHKYMDLIPKLISPSMDDVPDIFSIDS